MAKAITITYTRNTTYNLTHTYQKNGVNATSGQTLFFTVKSSQYDSDALDSTAIVSKTIPMNGNPVTIITINPGDIASTVAPGSYYFSIQVKESDGPPKVIYPCASGTFNLVAETTNRES